MPVKIRLQRHGRKQRPFYHIVVADSRTTRNGKFIERIGAYNPLTIPATIELDADRAFDWVMNGAQPTDTARKILTFKGVMYRKHLQRGVSKGALTQDKADTMYADWVNAKNEKVQERLAKELAKIEDKRTKRNSAEAEKRAAKMVEKQAAVEAEEAATAAAENAAAEGEEVAEAAVEATSEAVAEEAPVEETATEEAPAAEEAPVEEVVAEEAPAEEAATEEKTEE